LASTGNGRQPAALPGVTDVQHLTVPDGLNVTEETKLRLRRDHLDSPKGSCDSHIMPARAPV
jgi:hypothetical protein